MQNFSDFGFDEVRLYKGLGLTKNQAIIYLTLTRLSSSTVKQISKISKIAREEIYRICPKLVDLGLIKKIIVSPIKFEAIPIEESLSVLIKRRTLEVNDLRIKAKRLAEKSKRFGKMKANSDSLKNHSSFALIPKRAALIKSIKKSIEDARKSVSIITSMKRHPHAVQVYKSQLEKALSKGVKFRVIVGEIEKDIPKIAKKFDEHPLTSVRYTSSPPSAVVVLTDNTKGFIMTSPTADLEETPALKIENPSLIKLLCEYFEYVWSASGKKE